MIQKFVFFQMFCSVMIFGGYRSEVGQDRFVNSHFFKDKKEGFFVDIGAHEGVKNSNTLYFEQLGWKGICFEPDPRNFKKLKRTRHCILYQKAVGKEKGIANFIKHPTCTWVSGLDRTYESEHRKIFEVEDGSKHFIQVEVVNLNDILRKHNVKRIDFLSIDTEGAEEEIISSINFDEFQIDVITLENNYSKPFFKRYLASKGYRYVTNLHKDEVFVHEKSGY